MQTVKVLGKVTLSGGRIVRRSGCVVRNVAASGLAVRLLSSPVVRTGQTGMAFALRNAVRG